MKTIKLQKRLLCLMLGLIIAMMSFGGLAIAAEDADFTEIKTETDLKNIANDLTGSYRLANDIVLTSDWTPIKDFKGVFDGCGFSVKGLNIVVHATANWQNSGFFSSTNGAVIKNLSIYGTITSNLYFALEIGGFVGTPSNTQFINCNSYINITTGTASERVYAGGIAGHSKAGTTFVNCTNYGKMDIANILTEAKGLFVGGIAGQATGAATFENCVNYGELTATIATDNDFVGGIVAYSAYAADAHLLITDCVNNGTVNARALAGGIIAYSNQHKITIKNCDNTANVYAVVLAAGILCRVEKGTTHDSILIDNCNVYSKTGDKIVVYTSRAQTTVVSAGIFAITGKFAETVVNLEITNCVNLADVITEGTYAGGIVGYIYSPGTVTTSIKYCANLGAVEAKSGPEGFVGGIVGRNRNGNAQITNCYNGNTVTYTAAANYVGALGGSTGAAKFINCAAIGTKINGAGNSTSTEGTVLLDDESDLEAIVAVLNTGLETDMYRIFNDEIQAHYSLTKSAVMLYGVQNTAVKDGTFSVRFVSHINSADYTGAGHIISAVIKQGNDTTNVSGKTYSERNIYKALLAVEDGDPNTVSSPMGTYFLATAMDNIPSNAEITFTVISYVNGEDGRIETAAYEIVYINGVFVSGNPAA